MEIEKLFSDDEFKESVIKAESIDDLAGILKERGIDFDESELVSVFSDNTEGELNEDALEGVAGGSWLSSLRNFINALRYSAGGGGFSRGGGGGGAFGGGGGGGGR